MSFTNINNKNILIVDDDVNTSSKYKKWLEEEEGFNLTLINDPNIAEQNFNPENYDLVLIGFRMSVVDGFDLYHKLQISKKVQQDTSSSNDFRVCFMTSSRINYKALSEAHPEFGEECYVSKEVPKDVFIKHVHSLLSG